MLDHNAQRASVQRIRTACSAIALVAGMVAVAPLSHAQIAKPGDANCPIVGGVATCSGNLSDGVTYQITDPDLAVGTIIVESPTGPIAPNGIYGIGIDRGDRDMSIVVRDGVIINTLDDQGIAEPAQGIIGIMRNGYDLNINSGATITANGVTQPNAGIEGNVDGSDASVIIVNRGDVTVTTSNHTSVGIASNANSSTGSINITNSGALSATSTATGERDTITGGILAQGTNATAVNVANVGNIAVNTAPGSFDTDFAGEAAGIVTNTFANTSATTITNSGAITGSGPNAGGIVGFTHNNALAAPSTVTIHNTGAISTNASDTNGILIQSAGLNANLTVDNDAAISMTNGASSSGIVALVQAQRGVITIDNSAVISGSGTNYMRGVGITSAGAPANGTYTYVLNNTGDISLNTPIAQGVTMAATFGDAVTATLTNTGNIDLSSTTAETTSAGIRAVLNGSAAGEMATGVQTLTLTNSGDITMGAGNAMLLASTSVNARNSGDLYSSGLLSVVDITANGGAFEVVQGVGQPSPTVTAAGATNSAITVRGAGTQQFRVVVGEGASVQSNGTGVAMGHAGGVLVDIAGTVSGNVAAIQTINNVAGADTIINRGTINGSVFTGAGNDTLDMRALSTLTGNVNLGDGDDVAMLAANTTLTGSFHAAAGNDRLTLAQFATITGGIDMGDGDDVLDLGLNSAPQGPITLGAGNDRLDIYAFSAMNGVDGGAGTDIVRKFTAAGGSSTFNTTTAVATNFEVIQQTGPGAVNMTGANVFDLRYELLGGELNHSAALANVDFLTAAGTQLNLNGSMRSLNHSGRLGMAGASPQTVNMTGNVTFNPGSVYDVRIAPGGVSDRIATAGTATINGGTVNALVGAGQYVDGDSFTILTAQGGVTGQFAGLTQVSTAFLDISLDYLPNAVQIQLAPNRVTFSDFDLTYNQTQTSRPIDGFSTAQGSDTRAVVSELLFLNADQVAPALDAMSGELHASVLAAGLRSSQTMILATAQRSGAGSGLQVWGGAGAHDNSQRGDGNASSVSSTGYDAVAGADWNSGGAWVGAFAGWTDGDATVLSGEGKAARSALHLGVYGGVGSMGHGFSARGGVVAATGDVDTSRHIAFGRLSRLAQASYDLDTVFGNVEVRYGVPAGAGNVAWGPAVMVDYASAKRGAFAETGADALNLAGAGDRDERWSYGVGGFAGMKTEATTFEAAILFARQNDDFTQTRLSMAGLPDRSFTVRSPGVGEDGLRLSARGEFGLGAGVWLGAAYQGWLTGGESNHAAMVTLTVR